MGNYYEYIFAMEAAILTCSQKEAIKLSDTTTLLDYLAAQPNQIGFIKMKGEVVT